MFKHIFDELKKELDEVAEELEGKKSSVDQILKRWKEIKKVSDDIVEGWLSLEEKMCELSEKLEKQSDDKSEKITVSITKHKEKDISFRKGQGFYHLTMYPEAAQQFEAALTTSPDNDIARLYYALSKYSLKDYDAALQAFQILLASSEDPKILSVSHHMIGNYLASNDNLERSASHFNKAVEHDPKFTDALFNAGVVQFQMGDYQRALELMRKVVYLSPDDWEAMLVMSSCYSSLGFSGKAYEMKKQAVDISNHPRTELEFAQTCEETGLYEVAHQWYRRLERRTSFSQHAYTGLAWCAINMKDMESATGWLKKGLSLFPRHLELNVLMAIVLKNEKQNRRAAAIIDYIISDETMLDVSAHSFTRMERIVMSNAADSNVYHTLGSFLKLAIDLFL